MPVAVKAVLNGFEGDLHPEDQIILNDPYRGGTHLPDITLIMPVFYEDEFIGFTANRAHHSDVGADEPGSLPPYSMFLEEEGMVIPPHFLVREGALNENLLASIQEEMRNPQERLGDLRAQIGANRRGRDQIHELIEDHSPSEFQSFGEDLRSYSSRLVRASISDLPDGRYEAEEWMESTGAEEEPAKIACSIFVRGNEISIDFEGTDPQVRGNANAPLPVTLSACYYTIRTITDRDAPLNEGCYEMIEVDAPTDTLVHPSSPHAVSSGNVETSQRIVDVLYRALQQAIPEQVPAQSQGTMNNLVIAAEGDREKTYYETIGGGEGAFAWRDGMDGVHTHMTNTRNTPVEALEHEYPVRVHQYRLRNGSGGSGDYNGGEGIVRDIEFLGDQGSFTIVSERRRRAPNGTGAGSDGKTGVNEFLPASDEPRTLGPRARGSLSSGDRIRIRTPGGGGYSPPDATESD